MIEKYNSIYLGIVVQNNDPEHRGRVKVWVPHVSLNVYDKWSQLKQDHTFSFPGTPGGENISAILPELKDGLPWAEFASPIVGASTAGYYNAATDTNTVSDAPLAYAHPGSNFSNASSGTNLDPELKGGKPGAYFETHPVSDAFGNTAKINSAHFNQFADTYRPATYSNSAKGLFSIPNVGSHVWVFFKEGSALFPVYFGASFSGNEFDSIFKSLSGSYPDYPDAYENKDRRAGPITSDNVRYQNKMVLNQKGAAIEIINTTDRESYKVTHFGGGYYEINNSYAAMFNPKNFQLLTLADKFETINGHNNLFVQRDFDNIVQGDHYLKVGNFNVKAAAKWYDFYNNAFKGLTDINTFSAALSALADPLSNQEKEMGFGGNSFEFISKHKTVAVGLVRNNKAAYYLDAFGLLTDGNSVAKRVGPLLLTPFNFGANYVNFATYKELAVPDMPGGNYDIFAMNRLKMQAGNGGITMQTGGNMKMSGGTVEIRADLLTLGSAGGTLGIKGDLVTIEANTLSLKNTNSPQGQVVVDSTLGVTNNIIIGGGAYVEGELYVNHITAPVEYQVTENTQIIATGPIINPEGTPDVPASGWNIINTDIGGTMQVIIPPLKVSGSNTLYTIANVQIISGQIDVNAAGSGTLTIAQPHSHVFKNIPLTLNSSKITNGLAAASTIGVSDAKPIGSELRVDGRTTLVGVPPPVIFEVGIDGSPTNTPNGPGSNVAGPSIIPSII
jgi:hypothetical protein